MTRWSLAGLFVVALGALAACTSTESALEPSALTSPANGQPRQIAALANGVSLHFAPTVGVAGQANQALASRLNSRAGEVGIALAGSRTDAELMMTGYFSAFSEAGTTTVIYVWDVVDPQGARLHRIQGQQRAPAEGAEGWASVTDATMQAVADETMTQLVTWLATRHQG